MGRFISRDPIRWAGGVNLYGYTDNDPIQRVDPLGESWGWQRSGGYAPYMQGNPFPLKPPHVDIYANMQAAFALRARGGLGSAFAFADMVRAGGIWDYKLCDKEGEKKGKSKYERCGNFHFGAVAYAWGLPLDVVLREAGRANLVSWPRNNRTPGRHL